MPMSKKHYEAIATSMNTLLWQPLTDPATMSAVIARLADLCERDNPRFDKSRFIAACTHDPSTR